MNFFKLTFFGIILLIGMNGCVNQVKVPKIPTPNKQKVNAEELTPYEKEMIFALTFKDLQKDNYCVSAKGKILTTNYSSCCIRKRRWTAKYEKCYRLYGNYIVRVDHSYKPDRVFKFYKNKAESAYNKILQYDKISAKKFNEYVKNYLNLKKLINKKLNEYNALKLNIIISSNIIKNDSLKELLAEKIKPRRTNFYINYIKGTTPFDKTNRNYIYVKYTNPADVYYLYVTKHNNGNIIKNKRELENYIANLQIFKANSYRIQYQYEDDMMKLYIKFSPSSLRYKDLKIHKPLKVIISDLEVNFFPKTYEAENNELKIKYIYDHRYYDRKIGNLQFINKTKNYINVTAISLYYGKNIITHQVNIKIPPKGFTTYQIFTKNLLEKYFPITNENMKVLFGFAIEYTNIKYNKQNSLFSSKEETLRDVLIKN